jgi:CDP-diacylglycerol--glycerol-3-phosphate 3-phosphatidyltransferase
MDLGLYNLKYPVRRLIAGVLPRFARTDPDDISWSMIPVGVATAGALWLGAHGRAWAYLVAIALVFLRMFLGTLDGLVATQFGRSTKRGEIVNRLAPELCDAMLLATLAFARPEWLLPGALALLAAWLTTFAGLVGATAGLPTQSVGPAGQTDRLAALQLLLLLAFLGDRLGWRFDFPGAFLWWVAIGGAVTVVLRMGRHLRGARTG